MYYPKFVCVVFLLATSRKNYWTDRHEDSTTDITVDKEELIIFWKSPASESGSRNCLKDSSKCEIEHFPTILEKVIRFS